MAYPSTIKAEERLVIDDVTYIINRANAAPALEMVFSLAPMFAELKITMDKDGEMQEVPLGAILGHLNSPAFRAMREYLIGHVSVSRAGEKPYCMADHYDMHMNAYPSHYLPLIWKCFTFQFGSFFRVGGAAASLLPSKLQALFKAA